MDSSGFRGRGRGQGFGRGDFGGRGGRGRGRGFGESSSSPSPLSRPRSPVQQIRRNRLDDDAPKPACGPGQGQGFRGQGRTPFRGRGNFSPRSTFGRGFRPEIMQNEPRIPDININSGSQSFPPLAPERIFRNSASAPLAQFADPSTNFQHENNGNNLNQPKSNSFQDSQGQGEASNFLNAGTGLAARPWGSSGDAKPSGKSLLKPQYLEQALKSDSPPSKPNIAPPPPPPIGRFSFKEQQQQHANFRTSCPINNFNSPPPRFPNSPAFSEPFQHPSPNLSPFPNFSPNQNQPLPFSNNPFAAINNPFAANVNTNPFNCFNDFVAQNSSFNQQPFQEQSLPYNFNPHFPPTPTNLDNGKVAARVGQDQGSNPAQKLNSLLAIDPSKISNSQPKVTESASLPPSSTAIISSVGDFLVKPPIRYDGQGGTSSSNSNLAHLLISKLPSTEQMSSMSSTAVMMNKPAPEQVRVKPQPPPPPKIGISIPNPVITPQEREVPTSPTNEDTFFTL